MATKVLMEALSPTMEEGRLVEWKKKEGDVVAVGDVLAEVETDKAVMDLVARAGGVLLKQVIAPGTTVPVTALVGVIGNAGEDIAAMVAGGRAGGQADGGSKPAPPPSTAAPAAPKAAAPVASASAPASPEPVAAPAPSAPVPGGRVKASPLAKKVASDKGLDLASIQGSGPDGRIIVRDLANAVPVATGSALGARPPV
ncbi:MAG TPA: E3 binding domain-containing protein, partial [Gemmatimonadales bacterium]|nr:E3 binding domain-containing protein [Gemmatimonadales bacterium]